MAATVQAGLPATPREERDEAAVTVSPATEAGRALHARELYAKELELREMAEAKAWA